MKPFMTSTRVPAFLSSRVAWHEGMQLLPQHFQLADARLDTLISRLTMAVHMHAWGIDHLVIDMRALASGLLRIHEISGAFADGTAFAWTQDWHGPLERRVDAPTDQGVQRYALALPAMEFRDQESTVLRHRQYLGEPVSDLLDSDSKAAVSQLIPNLSLRKFDPLDNRYLQLPLVDVDCAQGACRLLGFDPPSTRLRADGPAAVRVAELAQCLRSKVAELGSDSLARTLAGKFSGSTTPVLQSLLSTLPRLEALLQSRTHPYQLFLALCDLRGALAWMQPDILDTIPEYDHFDPARAILVLTEQCLAHVAGIVAKPTAQWQAHALKLQDKRWLGVIPPDAGGTLVLKVQLSSATHAQGAAWLERALICRDDEENRCRNLRIRGYPRELVERVDELGVNASSSQLLLKVTLPHSVEQAWALVVGVPEDQRETRISSIDYLQPR
jgi:type VI secretion system protein ImpJ